MSSRDRLIEAARSLLWERGFSDTSPRDVMERSGVGQGSLYHHFPGKAELAAAALERSGEELQRATTESLAAESDPVEAVLTYLRKPRAGLLGCRMGRMTADRAVLADDRLRGPVHETLASYREQLAALIAAGQASGVLRGDVSPAAVAAAAVATVQGAHVLARADQDQASFDEAVEGAAQLIEALRVPPS